VLRQNTTKEGAVGAGLSRTVPQASDQPLAGPDREFFGVYVDPPPMGGDRQLTLQESDRTKGRASAARAGGGVPSEERGNSDDRQTIPSAETVAAGALAGTRGDSIKDGMKVVTAKSVREVPARLGGKQHRTEGLVTRVRNGQA
jgi:hypothetical protein